MEVFTLAALSTLVLKAVSWFKYLSAGDRNGFVTQAVVWGAGVGVAFLAGAADMAQNIVISGVAITDMDSPSKVLVGLTLGSVASVVHDFKKSVDNTDSASEPKLLK